MVLMGWTREELGRQPGPIVRAIFHRIAAPGLMRELAAAESELQDVAATDITRIPTSERAAFRRRQTELPGYVAALRAALGMVDDA